MLLELGSCHLHVGQTTAWQKRVGDIIERVRNLRAPEKECLRPGQHSLERRDPADSTECMVALRNCVRMWEFWEGKVQCLIKRLNIPPISLALA